MSKSVKPENLSSSLQFLNKNRGPAPVHRWNPPFCGDIDIRIAYDGSWHYQGSPIARESLVQLFASVLRRDDDHYYLVTPAEKVRIQVEDVPFVVIRADVCLDSMGPEYRFTTNVGDEVLLSSEHPLLLAEDGIPYIKVRDRLNARMNRNVYYQLIEQATEVQTEEGVALTIRSQGQDYLLGVVEGG